VTTLSDFMSLYRMYRKHHSQAYAFKRAWEIGFKKLPF